MTNRRFTSFAQRLLAAACACALFPAAGFAADGHVTYLQQVGTSDQPMMLAASDRGVVFVGSDFQVFRGYHHEQTSRDGVAQPFLWVDDIDDDRQDEVVGAGSPSFIIETNGDPLWGVLDGCNQYFVGDFIDDRTWEIFCRGSRTMRVWSWDGQEYFSWSGSGYSIGDCYADDFDSDRKLEVACDLSNGNHLQFDIEYDGPEENDGPVQQATQRGVNTSRVAGAASGDRTVTLGGREVTLSFAGGSLTLSANESVWTSLPIATTGVYSAVTADLDGDGNDELFVGGDDKVFVVGADGQLAHTIEANPNSLTRDARVEIQSALANGLENSDRDVVRASVEAQLDRITRCYSDRMGADQFTRVGRMLYELQVNGNGDVTGSTRRHSDIRNSSLQSCVEGAFRAMDFTPATSGSGTVNVTLTFDFVDRP